MVDQLREVPELGICGKKTPQADYALGDSRYLSIGVWPSGRDWGGGEAARSSLDISNVVSPQLMVQYVQTPRAIDWGQHGIHPTSAGPFSSAGG